MLQSAGYDLGRESGVPLAMDYNLRNTYEALDDATTSVSYVLSALEDLNGYNGDHKTDQTDDRQQLAGFGWARSVSDVGIKDWGVHSLAFLNQMHSITPADISLTVGTGFQHPMQALVCQALL
eukprot:SAG11_NODE_272_length_11319_cov_9.730481_6_plen_123_part_00